MLIPIGLIVCFHQELLDLPIPDLEGFKDYLHNLANVVQNMIMMNQQQANTNNAKSAEDTKEE